METVMESINLSYSSLPAHLKPCFLYLGLFPAKSEFFPKKLAKLWVSEGFIKETEGDMEEDEGFINEIAGRRMKTEEDTAKEYLEELTQRCLIQEATKTYDGKPKTYRIHSIFRQMCIREAQEYSFFRILDDRDENLSSSSNPRRLAVHKTGDWYGSQVTSSVRSIFCFRGCTVHVSKLLNTDHVNLLRVLHLEGSHIHEKTLPPDIGAALHLRYLNLKDTGIMSLPSSIGNLGKLEFLDLRDNHISEMPAEILKLTRLKELHMDSDTTSMDGDHSLDVSSLSQLRTLSIRAGSWMKDGVLGKLVHLKNFRLSGDLDLCPNPNEVPKYLSELTNLQFLRLGIGFRGTLLDLGAIWRGPTIVHGRLELKRSLDKLPEFPYPLTYLCLKWSQLKQDPMPILEQLPCLQVLRLRCCSYLGKIMLCHRGGFRNLQILELAMLNELEEWMVELGEWVGEEMAMPVLRRLVISCCNRLKMLPQGLHHLKELEVSGMPKTFNDRLQPTMGEDWKKIRYLKSITVAGIQLKAADASNECTTADGHQVGSTASSSNPRQASVFSPPTSTDNSVFGLETS